MDAGVAMDTLSPKERSQRMSLIRNRDTKPELLVRRLVHSCGFRYRLHDASLPGKPDMVFRSHRKVIFVHGCFWHRHHGCGLARLPKSRLAFWLPKLNGNRRRDLKNLRELTKLGWSGEVIWECETRNLSRLAKKVRKFLNDT
ncbi:MAG TPA: DNA mismatch endonuclease Vsr [Terriglobales bacterium]|nr:DNA mismatch endonuclease Vsr [Terriglobales bacterium]